MNARDSIKQAFFELAKARPIDKITIRDLVETCGINRNSFYYHFQDLPDLVRCCIEEQVNVILSQAKSYESLPDVMDSIADFILEHRQACIHITRSRHRDLLENNFLLLCEKGVRSFLEKTLFQDYELLEKDQEIIVYFYKSLLFGLLNDWLNDSMRYDIKARFAQLAAIKPVMPESMCQACLKNKTDSARLNR